MEKEMYHAKEGYNLIAAHYNGWKWQRFWHLNEYPYIGEWCESLPVGCGLDLGAGSGNNLDCFLRKGHRVTAVDISGEMLGICAERHRLHVEDGSLTCVEGDMRTMPLDSRYDWIISNRVIAHVEHVDGIVRRIAGMLKPGGQCFISDVHPLHYYTSTHMSVEGKGVCIQIYKHDLDELKSILLQYGLKILKFEEVGVNQLLDKSILDDFPRLAGQEAPIFYYMIVRREAGE